MFTYLQEADTRKKAAETKVRILWKKLCDILLFATKLILWNFSKEFKAYLDMKCSYYTHDSNIRILAKKPVAARNRDIILYKKILISK